MVRKTKVTGLDEHWLKELRLLDRWLPTRGDGAGGQWSGRIKVAGLMTTW